jgi:hypothetical protein
MSGSQQPTISSNFEKMPKFSPEYSRIFGETSKLWGPVVQELENGHAWFPHTIHLPTNIGRFRNCENWVDISWMEQWSWVAKNMINKPKLWRQLSYFLNLIPPFLFSSPPPFFVRVAIIGMLLPTGAGKFEVEPKILEYSGDAFSIFGRF